MQGGMASIHSAMVMGQHESVAANAQQIHDSFILQQELSEQDRKDLMSAVPEGFIKLDKEFHKLAASLAEAGRNEDTKEQHKLFSKMTGNCIQCHSKYVSDRFPGVKSSGATQHGGDQRRPYSKTRPRNWWQSPDQTGDRAHEFHNYLRWPDGDKVTGIPHPLS